MTFWYRAPTTRARSAEEEKMPTRPHVWKRDARGKVEIIEPVDGHDGPVCERCGYHYCRHCHEDGPPAEDAECEPEEECEPSSHLRCPFCGDRAAYDPGITVVFCLGCGAQGPRGESEEEARRAWGRRMER